MRIRCDLHLHTTLSDGHHTPEEVVLLAKECALPLMAITDHDTVAGVAEGKAAAEREGIQLLAGVELSTYDREEVHILGYNVPYLDPSFAEEVVKLQALRKERVQAVVDKLRRHGVKLVVGSELDSPSAGRSHVAELLVKQGYVRSKAEAFDKYLGKGAPCYVDGMRVTPRDGVRLLREAGAVPVLAHPYRFLHDASIGGMVDALVKAGLMGIEVYYPNYGSTVRNTLSGLAKTHDLIVTGGSDFHGTGEGAPVGTTGAFLDEKAQKVLLGDKLI